VPKRRFFDSVSAACRLVSPHENCDLACRMVSEVVCVH
jgi:hypothetical protein